MHSITVEVDNLNTGKKETKKVYFNLEKEELVSNTYQGVPLIQYFVDENEVTAERGLEVLIALLGVAFGENVEGEFIKTAESKERFLGSQRFTQVLKYLNDHPEEITQVVFANIEVDGKNVAESIGEVLQRHNVKDFNDPEKLEAFKEDLDSLKQKSTDKTATDKTVPNASQPVISDELKQQIISQWAANPQALK